MREIKFRAWDRDHNKMLTGITEIWRLDQVTNLASHESDHNNLRLGWIGESKFGYWRDIVPSQIELMQYTGLKDKNGKDAYEDDIVDTWPQYMFQPNCKGKNRYQKITFNSGMFATENFDFGWEGEGTVRIERCEIIGNIYENPELLNSEPEDKRSVASKADSSNADGKING